MNETIQPLSKTTWSDRTRLLVLLLVLGAIIWGMIAFAPLVESIAIAALLAYLLEPIVSRLTRRRQLSRSWAAAIVFFLFLLIVIGIPAWLGTVAVQQIRLLQTDFQAAISEIERWYSQPIVILGFRFLPQNLLGDLPVFFGDLLAIIPGGSLNILSNVTANLLWSSVVIVTLYYLLKDGPQIKPWLVKLAPPAYQPEINYLLDKVNHIWGKFLGIQLVLFLVFALLLIGGTLLVVWLFRSGLLEWSFLGFVGLLLLVYTAIQQIDNLWLRPQFMGRQLRLHPGIVFVSLIGALVLSGFLGALIVVPLIATLKAVGRYVHCKLLGIPPWPGLVANDEAAAAGAATSAGAATVAAAGAGENGRNPPIHTAQQPKTSQLWVLIGIIFLFWSQLLILILFLSRYLKVKFSQY